MKNFNLQYYKQLILSNLKKVVSIFTTGFVFRYIINEHCTNMFIESFLLSFTLGIVLIFIAEGLSYSNFSFLDKICEYVFIKPFIFLYSNTLGKNYKGLNIWPSKLKFEDLRFVREGQKVKYPEGWGEYPPKEDNVPDQPIPDQMYDRLHSMNLYRDKMSLRAHSDPTNLFKNYSNAFNYQNISKSLAHHSASPDKHAGFTHNINYVNKERPGFLHKSPGMLSLNKEGTLKKDSIKYMVNDSEDYLYIDTSKNHDNSGKRSNN